MARVCCSPATVEEAREQAANPEAYAAAAAAAALAEAGPQMSGETSYHTAMRADTDERTISTVEPAAPAGASGSLWDSEDFKSGQTAAGGSADVLSADMLSHSPTSTLQASLYYTSRH